MGFTSFIFPIFLLFVVALYYVTPQKIGWLVLLLASWFFYGYGNWGVFFLLPAFSLVTYVSAIGLERLKSDRARKALFIFTLVVVFGTLFLFKYLGLFAKSAVSIAALLGATTDGFFFSIVLPVGISFYTFQTASYVIDVYLGKCKAERHFGYYALFVAYFPQLVAGPIERFDSLMPQLKVKHPFSWQNFEQGLWMMTAGFVKKIAVADVIAHVVDSVYNYGNVAQLSGLAVFVSSALFFVQIYCDFSGYSDIAVGTAKMMGIDLMKNFNRPFLSENLAEFWSRWHISLSAWFNEYVYRPLAFKSKKKKNKLLYHCINTSIVMLLSGFWHGAEWNFLLWGGALALWQVIETIVKKYSKPKERTPRRIAFARVRTFFFLTLSMVLFRASDVFKAFALYSKLFTGWGWAELSTFFTQTSLTLPYIAVIALSIAMMVILDRTITQDGAKGLLVQKREKAYPFVLLVWAILLAWSYLVSIGQISAFIYFRF